MRALLLGLAGCIGLGGAEDDADQELSADRSPAADPTDPGDDPTDATDPETDPPDGTVDTGTPPVATMCGGSFTVALPAPPISQSGTVCPGEVQVYELGGDSAVRLEATASNCSGFDLHLASATGGGAYGGCGTLSVVSAVAVEVSHDAGGPIDYTFDLTLAR